MSAKTPRQRRRAKRIRSIKDQALNLVVEDGVEGFSVNKLAGRVDLTPGALYRYFDGRDEILASIQQEVLEGFDRYLGAVAEEFAEESSLSQFVVICRGYMALERLQTERFKLIAHLVAFPEPIFDDEVMGPVLELVLRMLGRVSVALEGAVEAGQLNDGDSLRRAVVAWSSVQAIVERRKLARLMPETFSPESLADELLETLIVGWGASREDASAALSAPAQTERFETLLEEIAE